MKHLLLSSMLFLNMLNVNAQSKKCDSIFLLYNKGVKVTCIDTLWGLNYETRPGISSISDWGSFYGMVGVKVANSVQQGATFPDSLRVDGQFMGDWACYPYGVYYCDGVPNTQPGSVGVLTTDTTAIFSTRKVHKKRKK